jgi:hypothetical protein
MESHKLKEEKDTRRRIDKQAICLDETKAVEVSA